MALAAAPFAAQAETINIYGWQNHSWEFVDEQNGSGLDRSYDRMNSNAGNIGFAASVDTGMNGIKVNLQCEQFTFYNQFANLPSGWCNRNSKIGLAHPQAGEIMLATWLLPYNEGVAQWVDPFYDAGADSHTSIMGSVGAGTGAFANPQFGRHTSFNRRQENIIQYWSPNWNGFVFRFAWTVGNNDETPAKHGSGELDPVIRSSSLAYTNGPLWLAVTWQDHEDWTAFHVGEMNSSDAESIRVAGRYIMDMGDGMSVQISAMYEDLEYEFNGVSSVDAAMKAFGYGDTFMSSGNLTTDEPGDEFVRMAFAGTPFSFMPDDNQDGTANAHKTLVLQEKTLGLMAELFGADFSTGLPAIHTQTTGDVTTFSVGGSGDPVDKPAYTAPEAGSTTTSTEGGFGDDPFTQDDESDDDVAGNGSTNIFSEGDEAANAMTLKAYLDAWGAAVADIDLTDTTTTPDQYTARAKYDALVAAAKKAAMPKAEVAHAAAQMAAETDFEASEDTRMAAHLAAENAKTFRSEVGGNVKIEREAWMVSGKIKFGGPVDFRFSYMDADDLEVSCGACSGDWNETAADAWNVGLFYTMPAGTELRLTYSEVDNDDNGSYGQGISGTGLGNPGNEIEMFAVGIVHWFD